MGRSVAPMEENDQEAEEQTGSPWFPTLAVPPHSTLDEETVREELACELAPCKTLVSRRSVLEPRRARGGTRQKAAALREEPVCMPHARHGHPGLAGEPVYDVRRTDPRGRYTGRTDVSGEPHGTGSARRSSGAVEEGEWVRGKPARGADGPGARTGAPRGPGRRSSEPLAVAGLRHL